MLKKLLFFLAAVTLLSCETSSDTNNLLNSFEYSDKAFDKLDPLLGYAHNTGFKPADSSKEPFFGFEHPDLERLNNGFALLKYVGPKPAIKIAVIGSSTSEPYMYEGSWPFQLHLLMKEQNISHYIYNGAVSGYNSTQSLLKLIRDVVHVDKIDIVIFMGPATEFSPDYGDIETGHPTLNPVLKYNYELLYNLKAQNASKQEPFSNRLKNLLQTYLKAQPKDLQLGVKNEDYLENSVQNVLYMNAICEINSIKFLSVTDVFNENPNQRINPMIKGSDEEALDAEARIFMNKFLNELKNKKFVYALHGLPENRKIFYDPAHLNSEGNRWTAGEILKILKADYLKN